MYGIINRFDFRNSACSPTTSTIFSFTIKEVMPLDIPWPFPDDLNGRSLKSRIWRFGSNVTLFTIGSMSKFWMQTLNTTNVHNHDNFIRAVRDREEGRPLLTICNHTSNIGEILGGLFRRVGTRVWSRKRVITKKPQGSLHVLCN